MAFSFGETATRIGGKPLLLRRVAADRWRVKRNCRTARSRGDLESFSSPRTVNKTARVERMGLVKTKTQSPVFKGRTPPDDNGHAARDIARRLPVAGIPSVLRDGQEAANPIERLLDAQYRHPGDLRQHDTPGARKHVAIVGAGMAGMPAGLELQKLGHEVTIFETSAMPGGRVRTHYFPDGTYQELGAMRIPSNHHCTLHYIRELGLGPHLQRFENYNPNGFLLLRDKRVRLGEVEELFGDFRLRDDERRDPFQMFQHLMQEAMLGLTEEERRSYFSAKLRGKLADYGRVTLGTYLENLRLSVDAIYLLTHSNGLHQYCNASFAEVLLDFFGLYRRDQFRLAGGMSQLVEAFAKGLSGRFLTNARVHRIEVHEDGVTVHYCSDNCPRFRNFDFLICTAPAPAVAKIEFEPHLSPVQMDAFRSVTYASAAKTVVHCTRPFWYQDGIQGGGASFTETPIQQVWYPNDDLHAAQACALTASYTWERNARFMASMGADERFNFVVKALEEIHPHCHRFIDDYAHVMWDHEVGVGAFAYFAPGDHNKYQGLMEQPFPKHHPRVWFAGEHLSVAHAWIQGAIQTGLNAVIGVLRAPCRS